MCADGEQEDGDSRAWSCQTEAGSCGQLWVFLGLVIVAFFSQSGQCVCHLERFAQHRRVSRNAGEFQLVLFVEFLEVCEVCIDNSLPCILVLS